MHSDIHYYGTYAVARAAGLRREICQTIATAAQFVDANDKDFNIELNDGGRLNIIPTAHPLVHYKNTEYFDRDQRMVWLPFHFFPGNEGKSLSERIICRKDSKLAQEMIEHCMALVDRPYGLYLVGIAAHVYADTFSHYGFSGVSSRWNKISGDSIVLENDERDEVAENRFRDKYGVTMGGLRNWRQTLWDKMLSGVAETGTGALGHGAVLKYPDYPYLKWKFSYEYSDGEGRVSERSNQVDFIDACEKLYGIFSRLENCKDPEFNQIGFDKIRNNVMNILEIRETDREKRGEIWRSAAENGKLFAHPEIILPNQEEAWKKKLERINEVAESSEATKIPVFRFFQAAAIYRTYVLRDLLPKYNLVLD